MKLEEKKRVVREEVKEKKRIYDKQEKMRIAEEREAEKFCLWSF